jgi:large subunit ribosomal protein L29
MTKKMNELRDLSAEDLRTRERDLDDQLFRLRIQKSMGQLEAPLKVRHVRRDLARVKTLLRQKKA